MAFAKAWIMALAAVVLAAIQAYQSLDGGWTWTNSLTVALAVIGVVAVYATANAPGDLGLSVHAKAVMASTVALLVVAVQATQPLVGDGSLSQSDMLTVIVAVLGAAGVWGKANGSKVIPGELVDEVGAH